MTSRKVTKNTRVVTKSTRATSLSADGKDREGGLMAKGRKFYKDSEGANLRPGIKGIRLSNAPVVRLRLVLNLSDERSGISTEAAESGRGGEAGCGA
jgi:hypothetical protein